MLSRCAGAFASAASTGRPGCGHVLGPDIEDRKRVRRRLDPGDIDFLQMRDIGQHIAELGGERAFSSGVSAMPGEIGHMVDIEIGGLGHGVTCGIVGRLTSIISDCRSCLRVLDLGRPR